MREERNGSIPTTKHRYALACVAASLVSACAAGSVAAGSAVADALRPADAEQLELRAFASGVQIYECAEGSSGPRWALSDARAELEDENGRRIGRHYGGFTWEATDGSKVVARTVASVDAAGGAVPLLLLASRFHHGEGVLSRVSSIQRLQTTGGRAPQEPCRAQALGRRIESPYTAVYYFYSDSPFAAHAGGAAQWSYSAITSRQANLLPQMR